MPYLNCPGCGLTLAIRARTPIEHCPRCLARRRVAIGMFESVAPPREARDGTVERRWTPAPEPSPARA